jgi:hypothetical protein
MGIFAFFISVIIVYYVVKNMMVSNFIKTIYEERAMIVVDEVEMKGALNTRFPKIKLYDIERLPNGELDYESDSFGYVVQLIFPHIKITEELYVELENIQDGENYSTYVDLMRVLTNVNFSALRFRKGYNFGDMNQAVINKVEQHVNKIVSEVFTYLVETAEAHVEAEMSEE